MALGGGGGEIHARDPQGRHAAAGEKAIRLQGEDTAQRRKKGVPTNSVAPNYVRANWAYSELLSPRFGHLYDGPGVPELKDKARQNVPFGMLTADNHNLLVLKFNDVRGGYFNRFFNGITVFQLARLTKDELGAVYIIPFFFEWLGPEHTSRGQVTFRDWTDAKPSKYLPPHHALAQDSGTIPFTSEDPVTVGQSSGSRVLLDGYHRAVRFWRDNDPSARMAAYVPL
jgi:hypothetical protein